MLLDYVSASLCLDLLPLQTVRLLQSWGDRIMRFSPSTGVVSWESGAWDSVRSDSHQIAMKVGATDLHVQGSPARVIGNGCTVFGSGASAALDLAASLDRMVAHASTVIGAALPSPGRAGGGWRVTRVDVTSSYVLPDLASVRQALSILRNVEGGRYRVSQQAGDTVYWSHRSRLRSGKAYAKGPHLHYLIRKGGTSVDYSPCDLLAAGRLLRLELKLGSQWFRERVGCEWWQIPPERFRSEWVDYFGRMIGQAEIPRDPMDVREMIIDAAPTPGQGRTAYGLFLAIGVHGWDAARFVYSDRTWYRSLKILRDAGLGDADISVGKVQQLRRSVLECREVHNWSDLRAA